MCFFFLYVLVMILADLFWPMSTGVMVVLCHICVMKCPHWYLRAHSSPNVFDRTQWLGKQSISVKPSHYPLFPFNPAARRLINLEFYINYSVLWAAPVNRVIVFALHYNLNGISDVFSSFLNNSEQFWIKKATFPYFSVFSIRRRSYIT